MALTIREGPVQPDKVAVLDENPSYPLLLNQQEWEGL